MLKSKHLIFVFLLKSKEIGCHSTLGSAAIDLSSSGIS